MPDQSSYVTVHDDARLPNQAFLMLLCAILEQGRPFRFRAPGASMTPFIRDGDVITITPFRDKRPRIGHVVAFRHPVLNKLLVHRIVAQHGEGWLLRGDNASEADGAVSHDSLLGRVTRVERDGRLVCLGLGPGGRLIAALSLRGWLPSVLRAYLWFARPFTRLLPTEQCLSQTTSHNHETTDDCARTRSLHLK